MKTGIAAIFGGKPSRKIKEMRKERRKITKFEAKSESTQSLNEKMAFLDATDQRKE